jgi:hypothetical protein
MWPVDQSIGEQQRALVDRTGMGVTEARFYRDVAHEVPVRSPAVWFAATERHEYIMVLEDLVASGCRFPTPDDADAVAADRDRPRRDTTGHRRVRAPRQRRTVGVAARLSTRQN